MANTLDRVYGSAATQQDTTATNKPAGTTQVTKDMFLQLLVAQIKNQDPTNPSDGVQFLTQLAQFQQLENGLNMGADISAIRTDIETAADAKTTNS
jgi:flagellar basal-body rod modification protein FlgD